MVQIKQEFQRQYGTTLDAMIEVSSSSHASDFHIIARQQFVVYCV